MDYTNIPKLFDHVISRELSIEILDELEHLAEEGTLSDPQSAGLNYAFVQNIKKAIARSAKLYGVSLAHNINIPDAPHTPPLSQREEDAILTSILIQTYPNFDLDKIKDAFQPREFVVSPNLPFVGGSRQGELDGLYYDDIENVFGPPSYTEGSSDNKVQIEWEIQFDNGVRATIYDYKQYDKDPYHDINYWSVGGNSTESAFEVYKALGLI